MVSERAKMNLRDYSQEGDPYGIATEYTQQSADILSGASPSRSSSATVDVRGNSTCIARPVPTQAEADTIRRQV